jgi:hypothetical protein
MLGDFKCRSLSAVIYLWFAVKKCPCPLSQMLTNYLTNYVGRADGFTGLGCNFASLGDPCLTSLASLISVSISFEKFPDKTHVCGVGDLDGLAIKVMASWTSK